MEFNKDITEQTNKMVRVGLLKTEDSLQYSSD